MPRIVPESLGRLERVSEGEGRLEGEGVDGSGLGGGLPLPLLP